MCSFDLSLEFFRMLVAIRVGMPPGEAIEMIEAIRADVWRVADAINGDNGYQPDKHYYQTATRLSLRLDELDEQINERIQEKTSEIRSHL